MRCTMNHSICTWPSDSSDVTPVPPRYILLCGDDQRPLLEDSRTPSSELTWNTWRVYHLYCIGLAHRRRDAPLGQGSWRRSALGDNTPFSPVLSNPSHPQYIACLVFIALISATRISFAPSLSFPFDFCLFFFLRMAYSLLTTGCGF